MIARLIYWTTLVLMSQACCAQRAAAPSRERKVSFPTAKAVLGLPSNAADLQGRCASDGLSFFDTATGTTASTDIYSISTSAEVKHLRRKMPMDFTEVTVRNFFPSTHTLVTLLEAEKRDDARSRPVTTEYFLSTSDRDGDEAELLSLNLQFKPLRIAMFGAGDYLVLGWDTANQLPLLVSLKPDGTPRRFLEVADLQSGGAGASANLDMLSKAVFVPWGDNVMMTFPGTTRPVRILHNFGPDSVIALEFPPGFVLHDVLGSDGRSPVVYRVESLPREDGAASKTPPQQRLLDLRPKPPLLYTDLILDKVPIRNVTCAARFSLTAIYPEVQITPGKEGESAVSTPTGQMLVGSAYRY